jgi:endonuclease YncB( thermonuclease family)
LSSTQFPTQLAKALVAAIIIAVSGAIAAADSVKPSNIHVIDGDTITALGKRIRLAGFDAPELGDHAHCGLERMLAARATSRLRQMIQLSNDIDLQIVDCSCRPKTAGTVACNYGRACGYLTVGGQDVGDILTSERLAHSYVCGRYSCPKRVPWCPFEDDQNVDHGE